MKALRFCVYTVLSLTILIMSGYIFVEYKVSELNKDKITIIAHAGGEVDSHIYTNTLEALDNSYKNGARFFELDISKTSDGHYVALHDWNIWSQQTGYKGKIPPSLVEFKKYKIPGKYTSLDFDDINHWFSIHSDSTLITDKIDEPTEIVKLFVDKKRLRMELFSKKSIIEAGGIFDGGMANYYVFNKVINTPLARAIFIPKIKFLKDNNIHYTVTGAPSSYKDKIKLKLVRIYGVKVYMYLFGTDDEIIKQVSEYRDYLDGVYYNKIPVE